MPKFRNGPRKCSAPRITFVTGPGGTTPGTADARMSISGVDILPEVEFGVDVTLFTVDVGGCVSFFGAGPVDVAGAAIVCFNCEFKPADLGGFPGGLLFAGGISCS